MKRRTLLTGGAAVGVAATLPLLGPSAHAGPIGPGWTEVSAAYNLHVPPDRTRHSVSSGGEHHFWLYDTDPSTFPGNDSGPRSELRFRDQYTSGSAQFECDMRIVSGAHRVCVMQVFGGATAATAFMTLAMNTNSINYYDSTQRIFSPVYDTWMHLNVVHDTAARKVHVFVNNTFRATFNDRGAATHYFKCGIYGRAGMSARTDVYVRNIHLYRQTGSTPPTTTSAPASWRTGVTYGAGTRVSYSGLNYQCLQAHTSQAGWEPPNVPALWARV